MKYTVKCTICDLGEVVNGQKQIERFSSEHHHNMERFEWMTGNHINLDEEPTNYQPAPLITGTPHESTKSVHYLNLIK